MIDESGDLGKSHGSTKEFVLAASVLNDLRQYRNIAKRARRRFQGRRSVRNELKHHNADDEVSKFILNAIGETEVDIYWTSYHKEYLNGQTAMEVYTRQLLSLLNLITMDHPFADAQIIIDRFLKGTEITSRFLSTLRAEDLLLPNEMRSMCLTLIDSSSESALQVHDFVAGSVFRMVERGDWTHYSIIEGNVVTGVRATKNSSVKK